MKRLSFFFICLLSLNIFSSDVDWRSFKGEYNFMSCTNNGKPIWGHYFEERYVKITEDRRNPMINDLKIDLFQRKPSPIVLRWQIENINQDIYHRRTNTTRKIISTEESFTDAQGLSYFKRWNNSSSSGWQILYLRWVDQNTLEYETTIYRSKSKNLQQETCQLTAVK